LLLPALPKGQEFYWSGADLSLPAGVFGDDFKRGMGIM
jgi:hypothetical protein